MRIRTIKPEFWTDPFMVSLPHLARLVYISLFGVADDFGYIEDEPERIAMLVMPLENPMDIYEWLDFYVASDRLEIFMSDDGQKCLRLKNFEKHQKVDRPTKSKIARESSRKLAIPFATRRAVAEKYQCAPGGEKYCECYYCGSEGKIHWHKLRNGRPSSWISFAGLELDHHEAESKGGSCEPENIILACRSCNRTKGAQHWIPFIEKRNPTVVVDDPREDSRSLAQERKGTGKGRGKEMEGNGKGRDWRVDAELLLGNQKFLILEKWINYRQQTKKPLKEVSISEIIKEWQGLELSQLESMVSKSIKNGYQGLFQDDTTSRNGKPVETCTTQDLLDGIDLHPLARNQWNQDLIKQP